MKELKERIKASILRRKKALKNPLYTKAERKYIKESIIRLEKLLETKEETRLLLVDSNRMIQEIKKMTN